LHDERRRGHPVVVGSRLLELIEALGEVCHG
jgi:hypothetical protein